MERYQHPQARGGSPARNRAASGRRNREHRRGLRLLRRRGPACPLQYTAIGEMLHADGMDEIAPGTPFESIIRRAVASGSHHGRRRAGRRAVDRGADLRGTAILAPPIIQRRSDGRWIQVSERRVGGGGIVAVYSDLTELKENEERVAKGASSHSGEPALREPHSVGDAAAAQDAGDGDA